MAKGTFYQHFESKEIYLTALLEDMQKQAATKAEAMIGRIFTEGSDFGKSMQELLKNLLEMPEFVFFAQNEREIEEVYHSAVPAGEPDAFKKTEKEMFDNILKLLKVDTKKVKAGVVSNYLRVLHLVAGSDLMNTDDLPETQELLTDTLIFYVFRGTK
jgi:AcrR family transcriptional regulator